MSSLTSTTRWPDAPLTESLVKKAIAAFSFTAKEGSVLNWSSYDEIDHETLNIPAHRTTVLSSSYTFRKALIRKHFLSRSIQNYLKKRESKILSQGVPKTFELELSFADELDEILTDELWELGQALQDPSKWWILKPGMADRGNGIRLFNSKDAIENIFHEFEEQDDIDDAQTEQSSNTAVVTSQLRHFVVQEYLVNPMLLDPSEAVIEGSTPAEPPIGPLKGHKAHLRVYCVASGALKVYMYERILALFAPAPYEPPQAADDEHAMDLAPHLTNTALQQERGEEGVRLLDELVGCHIISADGDSLFSAENVSELKQQIADILADTFKAAVSNPIHFQTLPNAFELFGVDFLVSHVGETLQVSLLEINAEPSIELTGPRLTWILEDLFVAIGAVCVEPFFTDSDNGDYEVGKTRHNLRKCLELDVYGSVPGVY